MKISFNKKFGWNIYIVNRNKNVVEIYVKWKCHLESRKITFQ